MPRSILLKVQLCSHSRQTRSESEGGEEEIQALATTYEKLGAIRTSLPAPNPAPKPITHVEEIPAARRVRVFKLKICPSSARLLYGPVPVALPATVDDVHSHG